MASIFGQGADCPHRVNFSVCILLNLPVHEYAEESLIAIKKGKLIVDDIPYTSAVTFEQPCMTTVLKRKTATAIRDLF